MQRNSAILMLFGTGHVGASEAAGKPDLAALCPCLQRILNCGFHGPTERLAIFELTGNILSDNLRIGIDFLDLFNLDLQFFCVIF